MSRTDDIIAQDEAYLSPSIRIPFFPMAVKTGRGAEIEDWEGRRLIDFLSAAAIMNIGHQHPRMVAALQAQAAELIHYNAAYAYHKPLADLMPELAGIAPVPAPKRVALGLSGGDANDGAIKLARAATKRPKIIGFLKSFHGNSYGALSLSAVSLEMRRGFGPFLPEIHHIPYPDCFRCPLGLEKKSCGLACLEHFKTLLENMVPPEEVAAVIMEPFQGDSGIVEPPQEYMDGITRICRENGMLFISEEVQTGMGRTGKWFAIEHFGIQPDAIIAGKALGGGMPISAIIARADLMTAWKSPGHVFCTGQNPMCCVAAHTVIRIIKDEDLVGRSQRIGAYLQGELRTMMQRYEVIGDVRGRGLLIGVDLVTDRKTKERAKAIAAKVSWRCWEKGLFLLFFSGNVLRVCPPLVIEQEQVDRALTILEEALQDVLAGRVPDSVLDKVKGW